MKRSTFTSALSVLSWSAIACSAPLTRTELRALANTQRCEYPTPHSVVYAGDSSQIGACLDAVKDGEISELRITSGGGKAWETLQIARRMRGRINLLVVDGLCGSSCANYLLPAAKQVRVEPHSYVLLHGSINLRDLESQQESMAAQIRAQAKGMKDDELARLIADTVDRARARFASWIPVQEEFAGALLACDEWLDPQRHLPGAKLPDSASWLLVTPEMAQRCLKTAAITQFWPPEPEGEFAADLGFLRARH